MADQKNIFLAVVVSLAILLGWELIFGAAPPSPEQLAATQAQGQGALPPEAASAPGTLPVPDVAKPVAPGLSPAAAPAARSEVLARSNRVRIDTPRLHGSISLKGARIDDLTLANYRETMDPNSQEIVVLSPQGAEGAYFAQMGWVAGEGAVVPDAETVWSADGDTLTPDRPLTLTWDNGQGLLFRQTITLDAGYMFGIQQSVENYGTDQAVIYPYGLLARHGTPFTTGFYILHEGLLGVFDGTLKEVDYDELQKDGAIRTETTGGWLGITDKYWLAALVPDQKARTAARFLHMRDGATDKYQADFLGGGMTLAPGGTVSTGSHFFAGAKEVELLDGYAESLGIARFDLAIDFGWFYFLTKPIFYMLIFINKYLGNYGLSILALTVMIKLVLFPLANKSYTAMSKMKKLQPELKKLQERFADDKMRLNQEMMAMYKKEKVNPASGCLPILVQIPVFFALYKVLYVAIEMRHAPFFGWIADLSAPDPTTVFNLFGLIPWTPPAFLMIGLWPIIMGITMWLQQKLNPQPTDPIQAKIFLFLPILFTFLLAPFPAGLVIYWAWNNLLSIAQQWVIMRRMGVKI